MRERLLLSVAVAALAGLLVTPIVARADDPAPPTVPAEVNDASAKVSDWLNGMRGKTEDEITTLMGKDSIRGKWQFKGQDQLLLTYKPSKHSTLRLFFFDGKVIKAEYDLTSS